MKCFLHDNLRHLKDKADFPKNVPVGVLTHFPKIVPFGVMTHFPKNGSESGPRAQNRSPGPKKRSPGPKKGPRDLKMAPGADLKANVPGAVLAELGELVVNLLGVVAFPDDLCLEV